MIIGLSGPARSGKDTVGRILVENHGFVRASFADLLRECALTLNPWVTQDLKKTHPRSTKFVRLSTLVHSLGWEKAKDESREVRRLLQVFGTDVVRNKLGDNVWVEAAMGRLNPDLNYVFTDCRFPNEADAVDQVWRIYRPGFEAAEGAHVSETALDGYNFDVMLTNDGTVEELAEVISHLLPKESDGEEGEERPAVDEEEAERLPTGEGSREAGETGVAEGTDEVPSLVG